MYEANFMINKYGFGINSPFILEESKTENAEKEYNNFIKMKADFLKPLIEKYSMTKEAYEKSMIKN